MNRNWRMAVVIACIGAITTLEQVVLMRTLLANTGGNEFVIGLALASWLLLTGLASVAVARFADKTPHLDLISITIILSLPVSLALGLFLGNFAVGWLAPASGSGLAPPGMLVLCVLVILPPALPAGALYSYIVRGVSDRFNVALQHVTLWESLGAAGGGFVFSVLLLGLLGTKGLLVAVMLFSACAAMFWPRDLNSLSPNSRLITLLISVVAIALTLTLLFSEWNVLKSGLQLQQMENRFGILTVAQLDEEVTIYSGRQPAVNCIEKQSAEQVAVLVSAFSTGQGKVAVLGGAGRAARELAGPLGMNTIHVQLNADIVHLADQYCYWSDSENQTIEKIAEDPLHWIRKSNDKLETLVVMDAEPTTIQASRLLTDRFFGLAASRLAEEKGFLLVGFGDPSNYIGDAEADLLASVMLAAKSHFVDCRYLPLDQYWLACGKNVGRITAASMTKKMEQNRYHPEYVNRKWLEDQLASTRLAMIDRAIKHAIANGAHPNLQMQPVAPFAFIVDWLGRFDSSRAARLLTYRHYWPFVTFGLGMLLVFACITGLRKSRPWVLPLLAIAVVGGSGIVTEVVLMNAYQIGFGTLYHRIGLVISAYMAGLGLGAYLAEELSRKFKWQLQRMAFSAIVFVAGALWLSVLALPTVANNKSELVAGSFLAILLLLLATGAGAVYQLAGMTYRNSTTAGNALTAGMLHVADHVAAAFAAVLGGAVMVMLMGFEVTLVIVAGMATLMAGFWLLHINR